jgi:hypothetical protein
MTLNSVMSLRLELSKQNDRELLICPVLESGRLAYKTRGVEVESWVR